MTRSTGSVRRRRELHGRSVVAALSVAALLAIAGLVWAFADWRDADWALADAAVSLPVQSGYLGASAAGSGPAARELLAPPGTSSSADALFVEVQDASGAVVPHAQVFCLGHDVESEARIAAHVRRRGAALAPGQRHSVVIAVGAQHAADSRGRARIPRLLVPQTLVARHGELLGDAVAAPDVSGVVVVTIRDDAGLLVTITDPDGVGVPELDVALFWTQTGPGAPAVTTSVGRTDGAGRLGLESRASWSQGLLASDGVVDEAMLIPDVPGGQFLGVPARLRESGAARCSLTVPLALLEVTWADGPPPTTGALRIGTAGERGPVWCRAIGDVLARPVRVVPGRRYAVDFAGAECVARAEVVVPASAGATARVALHAEPAPRTLAVAARLVTAGGPVDGPVRVELMRGVPGDDVSVPDTARSVSVTGGRFACSFATEPAQARWLLLEARDCVARCVLPDARGATDLGEIRLLPREALARVAIEDPSGAAVDAQCVVAGDLIARAHVRRDGAGRFTVFCDPPLRSGPIHVTAAGYLPSLVDLGASQQVIVRLQPAAGFDLDLQLPDGLCAGDLLAALSSDAGTQVWRPRCAAAGPASLRWPSVSRDALTLRVATRYPPARLVVPGALAAEPAAANRRHQLDLRALVRAVDVRFVDASGQPRRPRGWLAVWSERHEQTLDLVELGAERWVLPADATHCLLLQAELPPVLVPVTATDAVTVGVAGANVDLALHAERSVRVWRRNQDVPEPTRRLGELLR